MAAQQQALQNEAMLGHHFNEIQRDAIQTLGELREQFGDSTPLEITKTFDEYYQRTTSDYIANNPDLQQRPDILTKLAAKVDAERTAYKQANQEWGVSKDHQNMIGYADNDRAEIVKDMSNAKNGAELTAARARYMELLGTEQNPGLFALAHGYSKALQLSNQDMKNGTKGFMLNLSQRDPEDAIALVSEGYYNSVLDAEDNKAIVSAANTKIDADRVAQVRATEIANYKNIQGWRKKQKDLDRVNPMYQPEKISQFIMEADAEIERMTKLPREQFNEADYKELVGMSHSASSLLRTSKADQTREFNAAKANTIAEQARLDRKVADEKKAKVEFTKSEPSLKVRSNIQAQKSLLYQKSIGKDPTLTLNEVTKFQSSLRAAYREGHYFGKEASYEAANAFATAQAERLASDTPDTPSPAEQLMAMIIKPATEDMKSAKFWMSPEEADNQYTALKQSGINGFVRVNGRQPTQGEAAEIEIKAQKKFFGFTR